jgi:hypothetical protein
MDALTSCASIRRFAAIFFAMNPALYQRGVLLLIPQSQTAHMRAALEATGQALCQWLMGKLLAMSCVGLFVAVGLLLLGVPMALKSNEVRDVWHRQVRGHSLRLLEPFIGVVGFDYVVALQFQHFS